MITFINIYELTDHLDQIVKYPDLRRVGQSELTIHVHEPSTVHSL